MKKNNKRVLEGTLLGAALGLAAGLLLAPESGKELRKDIKAKSAGFYRYIAPKVKKMKNMTEEQYGEFVEKSAEAFAKAKKLSNKEVPSLVKQAKAHFKNITESFS